jgi:hypothetical protein
VTKVQIATILEDGTYGNRDMTDEEYAEYLTHQKPHVVLDPVERPDA